MKPFIIDTTLRDGEQAPRVSFTIAEKIKIANYLSELGIDEVELGTPAIGKAEKKAIKTIANAGLYFRTSCWCRAIKKDILDASKLGTNSINISLPVSEIQIKALGKTPNWVLENAHKMVKIATEHFEFVTMGAQDSSRADRALLTNFIEIATGAGASRIRLADTVGILNPIETQSFIIAQKNNFPNVEYEFHGHNDFGMATANTIVAIQAGVQCISATILGLGERAGNAALENIIAYEKYNTGAVRFNTGLINELCRYVSRASQINIARDKPIVGINSFRHESGIHTSAMSKDEKTYQVLDPKDYGNGSTKYVLGKHSGKQTVIQFFQQKGIRMDSQTASSFLIYLKKVANQTGIQPSESYILNLYKLWNKPNYTSKIN